MKKVDRNELVELGKELFKPVLEQIENRISVLEKEGREDRKKMEEGIRVVREEVVGLIKKQKDYIDKLYMELKREEEKEKWREGDEGVKKEVKGVKEELIGKIESVASGTRQVSGQLTRFELYMKRIDLELKQLTHKVEANG